MKPSVFRKKKGSFSEVLNHSAKWGSSSEGLQINDIFNGGNLKYQEIMII